MYTRGKESLQQRKRIWRRKKRMNHAPAISGTHILQKRGEKNALFITTFFLKMFHHVRCWRGCGGRCSPWHKNPPLPPPPFTTAHYHPLPLGPSRQHPHPLTHSRLFSHIVSKKPSHASPFRAALLLPLHLILLRARQSARCC